VIKLGRQKLKNDQQMNRLHETLSQTWLNVQSSLFPWLAEELGPLTAKQQELVTTLELVRIEAAIGVRSRLVALFAIYFVYDQTY